MEATFGSIIRVRFDMWDEGVAARHGEESDIFLCPGPTPGALVEALIGLKPSEKRLVSLPSWVAWMPRERPDNIPPDSPITYRFELISVLQEPDQSTTHQGGTVTERMRRTATFPRGGSVTDRMKRVDPTMAARYKQRSGQ